MKGPSSTPKPRADAPPTAVTAEHRQRILKTAMAMLAKGGRDALTTRAVAEAAGVQTPILYRLFHDKAGLLEAVADHGFDLYLAKRRVLAAPEEIAELLQARWRMHVEFGLTHPELYLLMYADPHPGVESHAAERSHGLLRELMQRVAAAGRLRVSEDRAARLFHAASCGIVMTLLGVPADRRDLSLSDAARDATLASILTDQPILPAATLVSAATTLRALVVDLPVSSPPVFTAAEHALLVQWLDHLRGDRSS